VLAFSIPFSEKVLTGRVLYSLTKSIQNIFSLIFYKKTTPITGGLSRVGWVDDRPGCGSLGRAGCKDFS
jgi:hypothetical protein